LDDRGLMLILSESADVNMKTYSTQLVERKSNSIRFRLDLNLSNGSASERDVWRIETMQQSTSLQSHSAAMFHKKRGCVTKQASYQLTPSRSCSDTSKAR